MLEIYSTSSQAIIKIVAQVNSMKIERNTNPRDLRNFLIMKESISATISRLDISINTAVHPVIEGTEEIGAVETEVVEVEMTGVEEVVAAVVMMKGVDVAIVEEEVVVVDAVITIMNIKTKRNSSSKMIMLVLELKMLPAYKEVIARQTPSFTIIRPTKKNLP